MILADISRTLFPQSAFGISKASEECVLFAESHFQAGDLLPESCQQKDRKSKRTSLAKQQRLSWPLN
jgi:hypothetical protein